MAFCNLWLLVFLSTDICIRSTASTVAIPPLDMDINLMCNDKLGFDVAKHYLHFVLLSVLNESKHHKNNIHGIYTKTLCTTNTNLQYRLSIDYASLCVYISVHTDIIRKQCKSHNSHSKNDDIMFNKTHVTNHRISRSLLSTSEPTTQSTVEPTINPTEQTQETTSQTLEDVDWWQALMFIMFAVLLFSACFLVFICACFCKCCCCRDRDKKDNSQKLKVSDDAASTRKLYVSINTDDEDVDIKHIGVNELIPVEKSISGKNIEYKAADIAGAELHDSDEKTYIYSDLNIIDETYQNKVADEPVPAALNDKKEQQIVINIHNHVADAPMQGLPDDLPNLPNETCDTDTHLEKGEGHGFDLDVWIIETLKDVAPEHWTRYWGNFSKNKITEDVLILLGKYKQENGEEWKELLPEIGPRIQFQQLWDKELLQQQQKIQNTK